MPYEYEKKFVRDRNINGRWRKTNENAFLSNVAPDLYEKIGCRIDKTVGAVLKEHDVISVSQLRKKLNR